MFSLPPALRPILAALAFLAAAAPATAEVQVGQRFGDWTANCENNGAEKLCHIGQNVIDNGSGKSALQVAVARPPEAEKPQILILAPLRVLLMEGLSVQIDDSQVTKLPYTQCLPRGCQTVVALEAETVERLKAGTQMKVGYTLSNGQQRVVPVSLNGFTAGFEALGAR